MILPTQINRLLILPNLPNEASSCDIRYTKVLIIESLLNGAFDFAGKKIVGKTGFFADGAGETDAVDGVEGFDHRADGFEAAGDVGFGLIEGGDDGFGEVEEKGFALLGAVALVGEGLLDVGRFRRHPDDGMTGGTHKVFICAAAQLNEVKLVLF